MVQGVATGLAIVLVFGAVALLGWLVGGGSRRDTAHGVHVLAYGRMFRGLGVLAGVVLPVIICGIVIVTLLMEKLRPESAPIGLGVAGFFFLIGFPLMMEGFRRQVTLDETGITMRGWFGGLKHIAWGEVESVENKTMSGHFLVRGGGKKIKLGHYLEGLELFAQECKQRLAPEVFGTSFDKPINRPFL
jgi:hypothetical protein